jgi:hypothetical protein
MMGRSAVPIVHSNSRSGMICVTVLRTWYLPMSGMSPRGSRSMSMSKVSPTAVSGRSSGAATSMPDPSIATWPEGRETITNSS